MRELIVKIWRIAGSRRFAIILLGALAALLGIGSAMPNLDIMTQAEVHELAFARPTYYKIASALQVRAIVNHPLFMLWPVFLFISVLSCTGARIRPHLASRKKRKTAVDVGSASFSQQSPLSAVEVVASAKVFLARAGWDVVVSYDDAAAGASTSLRAEKGKGGFWGSVAFHLGMLFLLAGVAYSLVSAFRGTILVSEGQTVDLSNSAQYLNYSFNMLVFDRFPRGEITLDKFDAEFIDTGEAVAFDLNVTITDPIFETRRGHIVVNGPAKVGGASLTFHRYGYSPWIQVWDDKGRLVSDSNVRLSVFTPDQVDSFIIVALPPRKINLRFFPDHVDNNGNVSTRTLRPSNPAFIVWFEGGEKMGFMKLGDTIELDGYKIKFAALNYWAYLDVVSDPAMPIMIAGFIIVVFGLGWRFYSHDRGLWVAATPGATTTVSVGGKSAYFPALFEDELKEILEGILKKDG